MIIFDQRGVPQTVASPEELEIVEKSLIGMLGMEYDLSGYFSANKKNINSMALFQIECVGLITTMELDKLKRAKQILDHL